MRIGIQELIIMAVAAAAAIWLFRKWSRSAKEGKCGGCGGDCSSCVIKVDGTGEDEGKETLDSRSEN